MSDNGSPPEPHESQPPTEAPPDGGASLSKVLGVPRKMSEARAVTATMAGSGLVAAVRALARRRDKKRVDPEADSAEADASNLETSASEAEKGDSLAERRGSGEDSSASTHSTRAEN